MQAPRHRQVCMALSSKMRRLVPQRGIAGARIRDSDPKTSLSQRADREANDWVGLGWIKHMGSLRLSHGFANI